MTINNYTANQALTVRTSRPKILNTELLRRVAFDVGASVLLLLLPIITFWAMWAGNPDDRLVFKGDILMQGYPSRYFVHQLFNLGEIPLWNPYQLAGMPLLADVQVAVYYLPNLMLDLLYWGEPLTYLAFEQLVVAHYVLGGLFFYAYLRGIGLNAAPALVGAIAFQFNGFFIGHRGHYNMLGVVVWVPAVLFTLDRAWRARYLWVAAAWTSLATISLSQMVMAGHPQVAMYSALFIGAYFMFRWAAYWGAWRAWLQLPWLEKVQHHLVRLPLSFGVMGGLAAGISLVALLPTAELLGRSMRSDPTYTFSVEYSLLPRNFITLLVPEFLDWSGTEFRIYAGILTLVLAAVVWVVPKQPRPEQRFYTFVLIGATLLALGGFTALHSLVYQFVPGLNGVRVTSRIFFFGNFALAVLAAFGAEVLFRSLERQEMRRLAKLLKVGSWVLIGTLVIAVGFYGLLTWNFQAPGETFYTSELFVPAQADDTFAFLTQTANQYLLFVFLLMTSLGIVWAAKMQYLRRSVLIFATAGLMALDLMTFAPYHDTMKGDPEALTFTQKNFLLEVVEAPWAQQDQAVLIERLQQSLAPVRVDNTSEVLPDNYSQVWRTPFNSGYNILDLEARSRLRNQWPYLSDTVEWDLFNVGYVLTEPDVVDPPEENAQLVIENSQGKLWRRATQPNYASFSPGLFWADHLKTANGMLAFLPDSRYQQVALGGSADDVLSAAQAVWPDLDAAELYSIGTTGIVSPVDIAILAGAQSGFSAVAVNGEVVTPEGRGMIMVVVDPIDGSVRFAEAFDTFLSASEADRLAANIEATPDGQIVALVTYDEGINNLTDRARAALATLGAAETLTAENIGHAYALIGVKGSAPGAAVERLSPEPLTVSVGLGAMASPEATQFSSKLVLQRANQITLAVENDQPGVLSVSEAAYPGWKAYVNGVETPVLTTNGFFRAILLPVSGDQPHEVSFVYEPLMFQVGAGLSLLSLSTAGGLFLAAFAWGGSQLRNPLFYTGGGNSDEK